MNVQRLLVCVLLHLATKAVKTCLAHTAVLARVASKAMGRAVWTSTNAQATPAVCMQTVLTHWGHTAAPAIVVLTETD